MTKLALVLGPALGIVRVHSTIRVGEPGVIAFQAKGAVGNVTWHLIESDLPGEWDDFITVEDGVAKILSEEVEEFGTYSVTIRAADDNRIPVVRTFQIFIGPAAISVTGPTVFDWSAGQSVSVNFTVTGGTGKYVSAGATVGSLPESLSISISGSTVTLAGTLQSTDVGSGTVTFTVYDDTGAFGSIQLNWEVKNPPRIVYAGSFTTTFGASRDRIARLMDDGTMDIVLPGFGNTTRAIAVDNQGRLITARNSVRRILFDGTLDPSWTVLSTTGVVEGVLPLADGRYVIFGAFTAVNSVTRSRVAILLSNGSLDTSFVPPTINSTVFAVARDAGGGFIVGGAFITVSSTTHRYIARLTSTGAWDTGFASPFATSGAGIAVNDIAIQSNGKIIVAGDNGGPNIRLRRLNSDGTLDTSWTYSAGARQCTCLALDESAGYVYCGSGNSLFLRRHLLTDGSIDTGFTPTLNGTVEDVVIQPDGKVIAVGAPSMNGAGGTGLRRYTSAGVDDGTFTTGVANGDILAVALQGAP